MKKLIEQAAEFASAMTLVHKDWYQHWWAQSVRDSLGTDTEAVELAWRAQWSGSHRPCATLADRWAEAHAMLMNGELP